MAAAASAIGSQQACAQAKCALFSRYVKPETKMQKNTTKILIKQTQRRDATHLKANVNSAKLLNFHTLALRIKKRCQKLNPTRSEYSTMPAGREEREERGTAAINLVYYLASVLLRE